MKNRIHIESREMFVKLFHIVNILSSKFNIDESHGLLHSMQILHFANEIYENEKYNYPILESKKQADIIYVAAILHDMCDKKYMNESEGIVEIHKLWKQEIGYKSEDNEIMDIATKIIRTMSYSKVKKVGYPELGDYQMAYHIVRESDLLCAYDFDRSMIYHIHTNKCSIIEAYNNAHTIFCDRILRHNQDNLFVTEYGKRKSMQLHILSIQRMMAWKKILFRV